MYKTHYGFRFQRTIAISSLKKVISNCATSISYRLFTREEFRLTDTFDRPSDKCRTQVNGGAGGEIDGKGVLARD